MKNKHFFRTILLILYSLFPSAPIIHAGPDPVSYITSVFQVLLPACDNNKDFACISKHLDSVFVLLTQQQAWEDALEVLNWKMNYAEQYDRLDVYQQALEKATDFLYRHRDKLGKEIFEKKSMAIQLRAAMYYYEIGNWLAATEIYLRIWQNLTNLPSKSTDDWGNLANTNLYLGVMARGKDDLDAAERYFLAALECPKHYPNEKEKQRITALTHKHLGELYAHKNKTSESERHYEKAIDIYSRLVAANDESADLEKRNLHGFTATLLGFAQLQKNKGQYNAAVATLQQAEKNGVLLEDLYQRFGEVYMADQEFEKAGMAFQKALQIRQEIFGDKHYKTAETFAAMGDMGMSMNSPQEALENYQSALIALSDNFTDRDVAKNPTSFERTFVSKQLPSILARKMDALLRFHETGNKDRNYLQLAWEAGLAAVATLDSLKSSPLKSDEDKHRLLTDAYPVYEKVLRIAVALGSDFYNEAFVIMEKSKSIVLLEAFQNANALHIAGLSDNLLKEEIRLKHQIHILEDSVLQKSVAEEDRQLINARLIELKSAYRALLHSFEQNNPKYYRLKYASLTPGVEEIRENLLNEGQALIEYFVGDSSVFVLVLTEKDLDLQEIKKTFPLEDWVKQLQKAIDAGNTQQSASYNKANDKAFADHAWSIYDHIFAPIAAGLPEKIIVIPDGVLGYVPFDALLTQKVTTNFNRYRTLPYLIKTHEISYCYSATLLSEMKNIEVGDNAGVLAVAPVFKGTDQTGTMSGSATRPLPALNFNHEEAKAVLTSVGKGRPLLGPDATKQAFMTLAPDFDMLHIGTHGVLDSRFTDRSYLAFTQVASDPDSSHLYVRDFYYLRLHAALVVLSACQTGLGEMRKGEGIISLAYGVIYSGAKSVVMTLWSVNETSTTGIMRSFYDKLAGHNTKSEALRAAKQEYRDQQQDDFKAHPYYWAAYTPVGDMQALSYNRWPWILLGVGILAAVLVLWRRRDHRNRQRTPASFPG